MKRDDAKEQAREDLEDKSSHSIKITGKHKNFY